MLAAVQASGWGGHPADLPPFLRSAFVANPHDTVDRQALSDIQHDYFHAVGREQARSTARSSGAVASLEDPYADYQTPAEFHSFSNPPAQPFAGVGIDVVADPRGLRVEGVIPGRRRRAAGSSAGDLITAVDGTLARRALLGRARPR